MPRNMTKPMNEAVQEIYWNNSVKNINKSTLKALIYRELVGDDNKLTISGRHYALTKMSLVKQCAEASIPLKITKLSYTGRPESALLKHYESLGYIGLSTEGIGVMTVLKALMLEKLVEYNKTNYGWGEQDRFNACVSPVSAQLSRITDKRKLNEIISSIKSISREEFVRNFQEITTNWYFSETHPEVNIDFGIALYNAFNREIFTAMARMSSEGDYTTGWPDLTLIKGGEVLFVEVKTTDKLHDSQFHTITAMRKVIPFSFSVCKVVR